VNRGDAEWLNDASGHLAALRAHLGRVDADDGLVLDAAALRLAAAIDCVGRADPGVRTAVITPSLWRDIVGLRNRIAHAYAFVDRHVLLENMAKDVDELQALVDGMLSRVGRGV